MLTNSRMTMWPIQGYNMVVKMMVKLTVKITVETLLTMTVMVIGWPIQWSHTQPVS